MLSTVEQFETERQEFWPMFQSYASPELCEVHIHLYLATRSDFYWRCFSHKNQELHGVPKKAVLLRTSHSLSSQNSRHTGSSHSRSQSILQTIHNSIHGQYIHVKHSTTHKVTFNIKRKGREKRINEPVQGEQRRQKDSPGLAWAVPQSCKEESLMWTESSAGEAGFTTSDRKMVSVKTAILNSWSPALFMATESSGENW